METEKYYGLDLQTTKEDSSIIDCEYPGHIPENPSLNTKNTSLLNKASTTSNYIKINNCPKEFKLQNHNDEFTQFTDLTVNKQVIYLDNGSQITNYIYEMHFGNNDQLPGTKMNVYIGFQDHDMSFINKLDSYITSNDNTFLTSDTLGCEAKFVRVPNDTTGANIQFKLNKCTANRIISFSYNNLPIFSINQTYNIGKTVTIYVCELHQLSIGDNTRYALFNTRTPLRISVNPYEMYIQYREQYQSYVSRFVLMYTEDKQVYVNTTIGTLLSTGKLTHLSGHDYLTQDKYKNLVLSNISLNMQVHHFEESGVGSGVLTSLSATIDMNLYVYAKIDNQYYQYMQGNTVNFSNTESSQHLGVYKLQLTT